MSDLLERIESDESWRREAFPAVRDRIFLAHAAVTVIPRVSVDAMNDFNIATSTGELDYSEVLLPRMDGVRSSAARLLECDADEVALLGPTSLGLSLVANGIDWKPGDEIISYRDDYPANVYPWQNLESRGVRTVFLEPDVIGEISPGLVEAAITPRTRLLALASNNFLTGYRLDIEAVSALARKHHLLFCLDAIQTVGAHPTPAHEVDFLCADSHKWMLGPMTAGVFYVRRERMADLAPTLLGAWNVKCPNFIADEKVDFEPGGRRYEPGVLNAQGLLGMKASIDLINGVGIQRISDRLIELKQYLCEGLDRIGMEVVGPRSGSSASGITAFTDRDRPDSIASSYRSLLDNGVVPSFRHDRDGIPYLRFSPHFYNTRGDLARALEILEASRA